MSESTNLRDEFENLVAAYQRNDEDAIENIGRRIRQSGKPIRLVVNDEVEWEESDIDDYDEFPVVTQNFEVFIGDELVYEGVRQFGSSLEDPTHTGLGGEWVAIRIDENEHGAAEEALEAFGIEIEWPEVPPAR